MTAKGGALSDWMLVLTRYLLPGRANPHASVVSHDLLVRQRGQSRLVVPPPSVPAIIMKQYLIRGAPHVRWRYQKVCLPFLLQHHLEGDLYP
jgi:hypothetical protein